MENWGKFEAVIVTQWVHYGVVKGENQPAFIQGSLSKHRHSCASLLLITDNSSSYWTWKTLGFKKKTKNRAEENVFTAQCLLEEIKKKLQKM